MLLVLAILASLAAAFVFLLTAFGLGMGDRTVSRGEFWTDQWAAILLAVIAVALWITHHYAHGHPITW